MCTPAVGRATGASSLSHRGLRAQRQRLQWSVPLAGLLLAFGASPAWAFDVITKVQDTPTATVWRIDQPNPRQHTTSYPSIRFQPGDTVSIAAGGCVQTGGIGRTWKRYVNPSGPNSDHLYHGLIWIPGINNALVRIQSFGLNTPHAIPANADPSQLYLRLGYEDDQYDDNSYDGHDDGTEDQCKNVGAAYIVISVGHGAAPLNPNNFVGIPPDKFRCEGAWAFHNFNTPQLSWNSYTNAFNFGWSDWIDPLTYVTFYAGRGIASTGNCEGMCLLADVGEDQFLVDSMREAFWNNYKASQPPASDEINRAHWRQLSAFFLQHWLGSVFDSPADVARAIQADLGKGSAMNYGLLSMNHGTGGHVLVPLQVRQVGAQTLIDVYDPNRPCPGSPDGSQYPSVVVQGNNWSYQMAGGETWDQGGADIGNGLGYIPYYGQDGWDQLGTNISGVLTIIFSSGVSVDQMTDSQGRKLYTAAAPAAHVPGHTAMLATVAGAHSRLDKSANGLARDVVRVPFVGQAAKRPRTPGSKFTVIHNVALSPQLAQRSQEFQAQYAADYGDSGQIYLVRNASIQDLQIALSTTANRPARMLIARQGQFYEVAAQSGSGLSIHPNVTLHSAGNLGAGATVQERDGAAMRVTVTHGTLDKANRRTSIETTTAVPLAKTAMKVQLTAANELDISVSGNAQPVNVARKVISDAGALQQSAPRVVAPRAFSPIGIIRETIQ